MFAQLASLLAFLPMLIHSILGCCWHHAHDIVSDREAVHDVCQTDKHSPSIRHVKDVHADHVSPCGAHQHETVAEPPREHPADHCPPEPCDEGRCQFTSTSSRVVLQADVLDTLCSNLPVVTDELLISPTALVASSGIPDDGPHPHSAGQRCALIQVWLI